MSWPTSALGQAGRWLSGGTPSTSRREYWGGDVPWISSGSLTSLRLADSDRRLTEEGVLNGTTLVETDAVLFVVRGMSLKSEFRVGRAMRSMTFGQDCKAIVVDRSRFNPEFLTYALKAAESAILALVDEAGHGTGRLDTGLLQRFQVPQPPMRTQTAIAEVLGSLDDKIAANERVVELAERWMVMTIVRESPTLPLVPLSELALLQRGTVQPSEGEVAHFSLPAFDNGKLPVEELGSGIKSAKQMLRGPAVLLSKLNPRIPRVWDLPMLPDDLPALASTEFLVLKPTMSSTTELSAVLSTQAASDGLQSLARGTSGSHQRVSPTDALGLLIPDVTLLSGEHREAIKRVGELIWQRRLEADALAVAREVLLPALMSGAVAVRELDTSCRV